MPTLNKLALKGTLKHLNTLYNRIDDIYGESQQIYEQALQECRRQLFYTFPGLTIILAESRDSDYTLAVMTHVLAPEPDETEHTLGWHDFYNAQLCLDDGQTSLSDVASLEVKEDETWWPELSPLADLLASLTSRLS